MASSSAMLSLGKQLLRLNSNNARLLVTSLSKAGFHTPSTPLYVPPAVSIVQNSSISSPEPVLDHKIKVTLVPGDGVGPEAPSS